MSNPIHFDGKLGAAGPFDDAWQNGTGYRPADRPIRHNCEICGGRGSVELRVRPRAEFHDFNKGLPPSFEERRDYPCPECSPGPKKFAKLEVSRVVDHPYRKEPGFTEHVHRSVADELVDKMLEAGLIEFRDGSSRMDRDVITATVTVVDNTGAVQRDRDEVVRSLRDTNHRLQAEVIKLKNRIDEVFP